MVATTADKTLLTPDKVRRGFKRYQQDPVGFLVNVLGWRRDWIWSAMVNTSRSVRDNKRTAVKAGHGVSKTYLMAGLCLWFLYCFPPATVVTTAPTLKQVQDLLWREIRQAHANAVAPLFGEPTMLKLDLQPESGVKWFATGFSARPDTVTAEATAFQGYHNDNVLVAIDEAAAVLPEIWKAIEHIGGNNITRILAVGNPTSSTGDFVRCFRDPDYNCMTVSVCETPNYLEGSTRIPGVYGREYEERIIGRYGADSDEYRVRVLGEISEKSAPGAYYAKHLAWLRKNGHIRHLKHNPRYPVFSVWDPGFTTAIWFFQPGPGGLWHVLHYYEACGEDMEDYGTMLASLAQEQGWRYAQHFAPFDVDNNQYRLVASEGLKQVAWKAGIRFTDMEVEKSVDAGIERTREHLQRCVFNGDSSVPGCDLGLDRLAGYQQKVNKSMSTDESPVFMSHPDKNGCEHGADAMRYMSKAVGLIDVSKYQDQYGDNMIHRVNTSRPVVLDRMGF